MKKLLILALILVGGVATADSTITSKQYVDAALDTLQSQISAKNTDTVLIHTGTAGEIGEKKIYNANNSYDEQTDALVTAGAFNSAVQNALASEFVCTEWQGDVHDNAHCLLYEVRGTGRNLFDKNNPDLQFAGFFNEGHSYRLRAYLGGDKTLFVPVAPNTTYTISRVVPNERYDRFRIGAFNTSGIPKDGDRPTSVLFETYALDVFNATVTTESDTTYLGIFCRNSGAIGADWQEFLDGFQVEIGHRASPYEPYTVYMPSEN